MTNLQFIYFIECSLKIKFIETTMLQDDFIQADTTTSTENLCIAEPNRQ